MAEGARCATCVPLVYGAHLEKHGRPELGVVADGGGELAADTPGQVRVLGGTGGVDAKGCIRCIRCIRDA